ncbi:MAG: Fic family protein [Magnetococcales bacterium]|nr:Fic family protein [Magnetococcales bacterium]
MTWQPKYTISHNLLSTIREIGEAMGEIKSYTLTSKTLAKLELEARELSAFASTSIEGNPLALTDVKRILKNKKEHIRDSEQEVLNYNKALQNLYILIETGKFKANITTLEKIQKQVVKGLMDNPADVGKLRQAPVVIRDPRMPNSIIFLPPDAKDVRGLSKDLLDFISANRDKIDPIILAGLFHRQCVIIHPFMDGNGRTTRLMTTAILGANGLDLFKIFSFENYYNQNITRYFKAVGLQGDYNDLNDDVDHTGWLEYFAEGILDELARIRKTVPQNLEPKPRLEVHHKQILDFIAEQGSITQREYGEFSRRSLATRKLDFEKLLSLDLIERKGTGRGTYYVHKVV